MNNKFTFSIDLRVICVLLVVIIVAMLGFWRPWQADASSARKITVTGTGKVTATPDSYQFNPSYQKSSTEELNSTVTAVTDKLEELGVEEKQIQVQSSAYKNSDGGAEVLIAPAPQRDQTYAYLTIKVANKELAQKVQDYIATTEASGQLTAYPSFSDEKQKQLKEEARDKAIADAKSRGDKTAQQIDAKLGKVIEVKDQENQFGFPMPMTAVAEDSARSSTSAATSIYAGEQDITFTVEVIFQIK